VTFDALIQFARVYNSELLDGPPRFTGTLFHRGSLSFLPVESEIPLVVDHDYSQEIGRVTSIFEMRQPEGRWYVAAATVTDKPAWLRSGTGASMQHKDLSAHEMNGWRLVWRSLVREITVCSPRHEPRDAGAQVLTIDPTPKAATPAPEPAGTPYHGDRGKILHRDIGTITAIGGQPVRTRQGHPIRRVGGDIIIDRPDGSSVIYCGAEGRADVAREHGHDVRA